MSRKPSAVAVAMETGLPLKIAGKKQDPKEVRYFRELVEPHLVNGIKYLGEVSHGEKVELLQNARATLFPIEWEYRQSVKHLRGWDPFVR